MCCPWICQSPQRNTRGFVHLVGKMEPPVWTLDIFECQFVMLGWHACLLRDC